MRAIVVLFIFILVSCSDGSDTINSSINSETLESYFYKVDDTIIPDYTKIRAMDYALENLKKFSYNKQTQVQLFKVANRYYNLRQFQKYNEVIKYSLQKSSNANDTLNTAKALFYYGDYYIKINKSDSAFYYYREAKKLYKSKDHYEEVGDVLMQMSSIKTLENDWVGGEKLSLEALTYFKLSRSSEKMAFVYNILGFISNNLGDYPEAIKMFKLGLTTLEDTDNSPLLNYRETLSFNLAVCLFETGQRRDALKICNDLVRDKTLLYESPELYGAILAKYTEMRYKVNPKENGIISKFHKAITILDSLEYLSNSIPTRLSFSKYYLEIGDSLNAEKLSRQAYQLSKTQNDKSLEILALQQLILTDPNNASAYSKEYIALNDSLQIAERKIRNKFARIEFETDQLQIERDRAIVDSGAFYNMFFIFLILIGAITYWVYRRMGYSLDQEAKFQARADGELFDSLAIQRSKVMEGRIFEKERISRELHDGVLNDLSFVRNSLAIVIDKGDLSSKLKGCKKYLNQLQIIEKEIHTISHDLKGSNILKAQSFRKLVDDFCELQHTASEINWSFEHDVAIKWKKVNSKLKVNIYRILQEAVQNINRHSYASYASIYIFLKEGKIHIHISDDGIGFKSATKAMGTGLKNIQTRADLQGGHVEIQAIKGEGMKIFLEFPY